MIDVPYMKLNLSCLFHGVNCMHKHTLIDREKYVLKFDFVCICFLGMKGLIKMTEFIY